MGIREACVQLVYLPHTHTSPSTTAFSPQNKVKLTNAVKQCLKTSPAGDCSNGPHGPIGRWEVSHVTDMSDMFYDAGKFNVHLSNWDVSSATKMVRMFYARSGVL